MGLFSRRRKRVDVGTFRRPAKQPPTSIDSLVDEGMLIIESGVRLSVKNQAILWTLRDRADFDHLLYLEAAREGLVAAAEESEADAARISEELEADDADPDRAERYERTAEGGRLERRAEMLHGVIERVSTLVDDESYLAGLALSARDAAWEEIGAAIKETAALAAPRPDTMSWDERDRALAQLRFDLEDLGAERSGY